MVDTTTPQITNITAPTDNDYSENENLDFLVTFDDDVSVVGNPQIALLLNSGIIYATYLSGSGTNQLLFRYTIAGGDLDTDGIAFNATSLALNFGEINEADSSLPVDLNYYGFAPDISGINIISLGAATKLVFIQQPINTEVDTAITPSVIVEIQDASSNTVTTSSSVVSLTLANDPSGGSANLGGSLSVNAVNGVATFSNLSLDTINSGYTLQAVSGILTAATSSSFDITGAIPTVTIDTANNILDANKSTYVVTGTCSENTRTVTIDIGGVISSPTCSAGIFNTGNVDVSALLDSPTVTITADHDDGTTAAIQASTNVLKDTDVPDIISNATTDNTYNLGQTISLSVVFDQAVTVTNFPRIELLLESQSSANIYATYTGGSGTNTLNFDYTVAAGDADSNGINLNSNIDLNSGSILDANANPANLILSTTSFNNAFIDSDVPSITSLIEPVDATYPESASVLFQVNFNETVIVTGNPRISLNIGGTTRYADYSTGSNTAGLEFEYIVQAGDSDLDGITLNSNAIEHFSGSTIKGVDTDDAVLDFSLHIDSLSSVIIDTASGITPPDQVTSLSAAPTTSNSELALSWSVPNDNGTSLIDYSAQYRELGNSTWINITPNPTTNSTTVTGLSSGVTYEFRVAANNGLLGSYSTITSAEIFDVTSLDPIAWLDATNIFGNGTSPADGDKVSAWVDLTASATDATEATPANQPTFELNVQNGLPAVRFDEHDRGLEGSFTRSNGTDLTFIVVGQFNSGFTDKAFFEFSDGGSARGFFIERRYASNTYYSPATTKDSFQIWTIENSGATAVVKENNTEIFNGATLFNTDFTGVGNYVLGDDITGGNRMKGYIAEFLVFDRALTPTEINTLKTYLKNKWNTP